MKRHLKRITAPKSWKIARKTTAFIIRPNPGAHSLSTGIPLAVLLREYTGHATTLREVRDILRHKTVLVDGKQRKDPKCIVGLLDVISIKEAKENLRIVLNSRGQLQAIQINDKEAALKPKKIVDKTKISKGRTQLNFFDGTNLIVTEDKYQTGDTLIMEFPNKIIEHIALGKETLVYVTGGKHTGDIARVESADANTLTLKGNAGEYPCQRKNCFAVGSKEPAITLTK